MPQLSRKNCKSPFTHACIYTLDFFEWMPYRVETLTLLCPAYVRPIRFPHMCLVCACANIGACTIKMAN